ncbi:MAG TPA: penicillin-binding protein 2 [Verrucomicrobiae bacterium]|nr:penicillin-binding protein 2 [Verrucomicrobiae bacterium]
MRPLRDPRDYQEERRLGARVTVIQVLFGAVLAVYLMTFWYLQVVRADYYRRLSDSNHLRRVTIAAERGLITDVEERPLVGNRIAFNIRLDREKTENLDALLPRLATVLNVSEATLRDRLARARGRPRFEPVVLKEDVDLKEVAWIEARRLELPMLSVEIESRREYPHGDLAAHVLGYVGEATEEQVKSDPEDLFDLGDIVGKAGLEREYETSLHGIKGWKEVVVNSHGREMQEVGEGRPPSPGHALRLTIDLDLQRTLEEAYGEELGSAVFLDAKTGAVLAMISRPAFDPNVFAHRFSQDVWQSLVRDPRHPLQDRVSLSKFAPGSVFKVVMTIAALEEGVAKPERLDHCTGSWRFGERVFQCWGIRKGGHGWVDMRQALIESCNVYFYRLGNEMGIEKIAKWAHLLGFGQATGIDLPHEESGTVPDPDWKAKAVPRDPIWHPGETISVAIGQGALEVTPLQMAVFAATVGSGGTVLKPHLVQAREAREGVEQGNDNDAVLRHLPLHPETIKVVKEAMWGVVNEAGGTGAKARIEAYDVCGKTGTAQVFKVSRDIDADKLPKDKRDHAWFVGFAPKDDPQIAFAVFVQNGGHGGTVSAPIAKAVLERFFAQREGLKGGLSVASAAPPR